MKKSELKALIREVIEETTYSFSEYVYIDEAHRAHKLDGNFVQDYIEGVEEGTFKGAVYKRITK